MNSIVSDLRQCVAEGVKEWNVLCLLNDVSVKPGHPELTLNAGFSLGKSLLYMTVSMLRAAFLEVIVVQDRERDSFSWN